MKDIRKIISGDRALDITDNEPITVYIGNALINCVKDASELFDIDIDKVKSMTDLEFDDFIQNRRSMVKQFDITKMIEQGISEKEIAEYAERIQQIIERLWLFNNSLIFIMDIDKVRKLPRITKEDVSNINFDAITNSIITFSRKEAEGTKYLPLYLDYFDTDYLKAAADSREPIYRFRVHGGNVESKSYDVIERYNLAFVTSKLPTVFREGNNETLTNICELCKECNKRHFESEYTFDIPYRGLEQTPVCHLSGRRQSECNCFSYKELGAGDALAVIAYISKVYENRKRLINKSAVDIAEYRNKGKVRLMCNSKIVEETDNEQYRIVSLIEYTRQEELGTGKYSIRSNINHRNHSSPVEHIRKSHFRHYKSGKVVEVKQTVINKGKGTQTIYKVT